MTLEDVIIVFSIIICCCIVFLMMVRMLLPKKNKEAYAEVIKKNQFVEPNYKENGIRKAKTLYSISFIINGKRKTFYCYDGIYNYVKVGDKVRIIHNRDRIINLDHVK